MKSTRKGLFLYGANCNQEVWEDLRSYFPDEEIIYAEYTHKITRSAKTVSDLADGSFSSMETKRQTL